MKKPYTILVLTMTLSACSQYSQAEQVVGSDNCRFMVPSGIEMLDRTPIGGGDSSVRSIHLRVDHRELRKLIPSVGGGGNEEFRFIVSCESDTVSADAVALLMEQGISLPIIESDRVLRQPDAELYRVYTNQNKSAWVLVNFDPRQAFNQSMAGDIVATCQLMSSSAGDEYRCVHTAMRGDVRLEYRFGPENTGNLNEIDRSIFSILKRER